MVKLNAKNGTPKSEFDDLRNEIGSAIGGGGFSEPVADKGPSGNQERAPLGVLPPPPSEFEDLRSHIGSSDTFGDTGILNNPDTHFQRPVPAQELGAVFSQQNDFPLEQRAVSPEFQTLPDNVGNGNAVNDSGPVPFQTTLPPGVLANGPENLGVLSSDAVIPPSKAEEETNFGDNKEDDLKTGNFPEDTDTSGILIDQTGSLSVPILPQYYETFAKTIRDVISGTIQETACGYLPELKLEECFDAGIVFHTNQPILSDGKELNANRYYCHVTVNVNKMKNVVDPFNRRILNISLDVPVYFLYSPIYDQIRSNIEAICELATKMSVSDDDLKSKDKKCLDSIMDSLASIGPYAALDKERLVGYVEEIKFAFMNIYGMGFDEIMKGSRKRPASSSGSIDGLDQEQGQWVSNFRGWMKKYFEGISTYAPGESRLALDLDETGAPRGFVVNHTGVSLSNFASFLIEQVTVKSISYHGQVKGLEESHYHCPVIDDVLLGKQYDEYVQFLSDLQVSDVQEYYHATEVDEDWRELSKFDHHKNKLVRAFFNLYQQLNYDFKFRQKYEIAKKRKQEVEHNFVRLTTKDRRIVPADESTQSGFLMSRENWDRYQRLVSSGLVSDIINTFYNANIPAGATPEANGPQYAWFGMMFAKQKDIFTKNLERMVKYYDDITAYVLSTHGMRFSSDGYSIESLPPKGDYTSKVKFYRGRGPDCINEANGNPWIGETYLDDASIPVIVETPYSED